MSSRPQTREEWQGTVRADRQEVLLTMADIIGRKWYPLILYQLHVNGSMRFSDLKDDIDDISSKMLSDSLGALEEEFDLVDRTVVETKPLCVEYSLTDRGESVGPIIGDLRRWGAEHLHQSADTGSTRPS